VLRAHPLQSASCQIEAARGRARHPGTAMHEQMSLRRLADLPAKDQEALDIFAGRGDLVGLRLDHIMKAQDQPPVRRKRCELGRVRRVRAKDRQDVRHPGGGMLAEFRDAADGDARRCAAGAHWLALALAS
jgi:hypothetical protein